ncbi:hypothetical protein DCC81_24980 [Chitinophaga parva]|uniref:FAS1 domain-containing protein n=1 Tax=Chitinophaga parva TaxID=2169414 RepID=A0A2T7BBS1_9BACT|nr:fasciclin domain-containing protein [Chitinophaga parva]PUZ21844.1 hypothetical protein DCC81_24980 [Chitinophaga parva]
MKANIKRLFCALALGTSIMAGCKKNALTVDQPSSSIRAMGDFIRNNYNLSLLAAGLQKIGFLDSLNTGTYTLFAPENSAFNAMGITRASDFDNMNTDSLRQALKYLVIPGRVYIADLPTQLDNIYTSLSGGPLYVSVTSYGNGADNYRVVINGCPVEDAPKRNIALTNGAMHLLQAIPKYFPGTIQGFLAKDTAATLFVQLLKQSRQWDSLALKGPYTVYAPTNDVMLRYGLTADSIAHIDVSRYQPIAYRIYTLGMAVHHVFSTDKSMVSVPNATVSVYGWTIMPDASLFIRPADGKTGAYGPSSVYYGDGRLSKDNLTDNGVVYHIKDLMNYPYLLPQQ